MTARLGLLVAAAVALAALAYALVAVNAERTAEATATRAVATRSPVLLARARREFAHADELGWGVAPLMAQARMELKAGRKRRALALYEEAVRREPDNAEPWSFLAFGSASRRTQHFAIAQLRRLQPPVP